MDRRLVQLISRDEIAGTVRRLASEIDDQYRHSDAVLVAVLKGAFVFLADLIREMETPIASVEFLRISSYGSATESTGQARVLTGIPGHTIKGRHVILVEDIVDTGMTTAAALRYLRRHRPASLEVCALLDKPSRRRVPVTVDYLGLTVPDRFVVGYGLDLDQRCRQLPGIYTLED